MDIPYGEGIAWPSYSTTLGIEFKNALEEARRSKPP